MTREQLIEKIITREAHLAGEGEAPLVEPVKRARELSRLPNACLELIAEGKGHYSAGLGFIRLHWHD
jgi:hypothetical protein